MDVSNQIFVLLLIYPINTQQNDVIRFVRSSNIDLNVYLFAFNALYGIYADLAYAQLIITVLLNTIDMTQQPTQTDNYDI